VACWPAAATRQQNRQGALARFLSSRVAGLHHPRLQKPVAASKESSAGLQRAAKSITMGVFPRQDRPGKPPRKNRGECQGQPQRHWRCPAENDPQGSRWPITAPATADTGAISTRGDDNALLPGLTLGLGCDSWRTDGAGLGRWDRHRIWSSPTFQQNLRLQEIAIWASFLIGISLPGHGVEESDRHAAVRQPVAIARSAGGFIERASGVFSMAQARINSGSFRGQPGQPCPKSQERR